MPSKEAIDMIYGKLKTREGKPLEQYPEHMQILQDTHRLIQTCGGWRSGKSTLSMAFLITRFWLGTYYAIIGADYELCRQEFMYLVDFARQLGIIKSYHFPARDQCTLELSRGKNEPPTVIETKSAKYPERIAAKAYDGVVLCEAAQQPYDIFIACQGRLVEKNGWMFMQGTLESPLDWYADKSREWRIPDNPENGVSYSLPSWVNKTAFPGGRKDPKLIEQETILGHDLFMMRFGGEAFVPKDLVFPEFKVTLHTGYYPYDDRYPVNISIDPGFRPSCYAVLFVQYRGDDLYVIDEIYEQQKTTEQIIKMVQDKPFYSLIESGGGTAMDKAAEQSIGISIIATSHYQLWREKTRLYFDHKRVPIEEGIDRVRPFFIPHPVHQTVRIHINSSCRGLISELGGCKSPFADEGRGSWRIQPDGKPRKDNCDASKSLIYSVVSRYGLGPSRRLAPVSYMGTY